MVKQTHLFRKISYQLGPTIWSKSIPVEVKCLLKQVNYSLAVAILSLQQILLVPLVLGHLLLRSAKIIRFVASFQKIYDDRVHLVKMSLKEVFAPTCNLPARSKSP